MSILPIAAVVFRLGCMSQVDVRDMQDVLEYHRSLARIYADDARDRDAESRALKTIGKGGFEANLAESYRADAAKFQRRADVIEATLATAPRCKVSRP